MSAPGGGIVQRLPYALESLDWSVALAHYEAERLEEAYEAALDLGIGLQTQYLSWHRTIEAEYMTSVRAKIERISDWLELEAIPEEIGSLGPGLGRAALDAFDEVGARFQFPHGTAVRVTVLALETDAPWLYGRYGYCTPKSSFYKICIPLSIAGDSAELGRTLRHEYAHVVVGTLSRRRAPRWLEEAAAMAAERSPVRPLASLFQNRQIPWHTPRALEAAFRSPYESQELWHAYAQAGLIGLYLGEAYGEAKIAEILRSFPSRTFLQELQRTLAGRTLDEEAVLRSLKMKQGDLFLKVRDWARAGRF